MRVTRTRKVTVNLGNYESVSYGAEISIDNFDLGLTEEDLSNLSNEQLADVHEKLLDKAKTMLAYTLKDEANLVRNQAPSTSKAKSLIA